MMKRFDISGRRAFFLALLGLVILYALFQARFLILGPRVRISSPANGAVVEAGAITVEGRAGNVAWISMQGRQIYVDENGLFQEKLIAPSGPSIITVSARDRFGRETTKRVEILAK